MVLRSFLSEYNSPLTKKLTNAFYLYNHSQLCEKSMRFALLLATVLWLLPPGYVFVKLLHELFFTILWFSSSLLTVIWFSSSSVSVILYYFPHPHLDKHLLIPFNLNLSYCSLLNFLESFYLGLSHHFSDIVFKQWMLCPHLLKLRKKVLDLVVEGLVSTMLEQCLHHSRRSTLGSNTPLTNDLWTRIYPFYCTLQMTQD